MSFVKMLPMQRNCESRLDMMAARIPAVRSPPRTGLVSLFTKNARTALGFEKVGGTTIFPSIAAEVAQAPMSTQGTQTSMMSKGCATTASLNELALVAVSQCWKR